MKTSERTISRRAFTLTELLVVITLLVIVIAVGLPAFGAMLSSSNRTLAVGQFRAAMAASRDAAIRSTDSDSAAVFYFEPGGRLTIVPCIQVGTMLDRDPLNAGQFPNTSMKRDVFAPSGSSEPIQLPVGWMVRAFAGSAMLDDGNNNATGWYPASPDREYDRRNGSWVFPETGFYDADADSDTRSPGRTYRQTFMVRFEKGTGNLVVNQSAPAVVVSPRDSTLPQGGITRRAGTPLATDWRRVDRSDNLAQWSKRLLSRRVVPAGGGGKVSPTDLAGLIGDESGDTVLAASVDLVTLYDEKSLSAAIGARGLNAFSGSIYLWGETGNAGSPLPNEPKIDTALFSGLSPATVGQRIDQWMVGTLQVDGRLVASDALIYGFDRYTGQPREVKP